MQTSDRCYLLPLITLVLYDVVLGVGWAAAPSGKCGAAFVRSAVFPLLVPVGLCSSPPRIRALQGKKTLLRLLASAGVAGSIPGEHPFLFR